jgi:chloramphenicol 3-O phosphotransferase
VGYSVAMVASGWPRRDEVPALLSALIGGDAAAVASSPAAAMSVTETLAEIASGDPVVEWFGVNERRVDAVVSSSSHQFRIVYFTSDGVHIDELVVFRRPPPFDGVAGGRVIVVNGPSGSGKSSVLAAIADASSMPWVIVDEPVLGTVDQPYLIWPDRAPGLHRGFLDALAALARRDNLVALSAGGHPAAVIDAVFDGVDVVRIGLDCDVATLVRRERGREGRWGGLAASSLTDHDGWRYDARFDTTQTSATAIARDVLSLVRIPQH